MDAIARYLATVVYFFSLQEIQFLPRKVQKPKGDRLVDGKLA